MTLEIKIAGPVIIFAHLFPVQNEPYTNYNNWNDPLLKFSHIRFSFKNPINVLSVADESQLV